MGVDNSDNFCRVFLHFKLLSGSKHYLKVYQQPSCLIIIDLSWLSTLC